MYMQCCVWALNTKKQLGLTKKCFVLSHSCANTACVKPGNLELALVTSHSLVQSPMKTEHAILASTRNTARQCCLPQVAEFHTFLFSWQAQWKFSPLNHCSVKAVSSKPASPTIHDKYKDWWGQEISKPLRCFFLPKWRLHYSKA